MVVHQPLLARRFTAALPDGADLVLLDDARGTVTPEPAGRNDWSRTHHDMIAREILATSFESAEPADGVAIGDGCG